MLYLTITTDILDLTKLHISKYYRFSLLLINKARNCCASQASVLEISSAEYTIVVKEYLRFKQSWRYFYYFYFSAVARDFADV